MILRPSGGLLYHWRALRHGKRWQPFRDQVDSWLKEWRPTSPQLVLIGPSAGYSLPSAWLRQFQSITAFDLDPLAAPLFALRHPGLRVRFHRQDMFWHAGRLSTDALKKVLTEQPTAAVLFANVLGQVLLEGKASEEEWKAFLLDLRRSLEGWEWASYHDLSSSRNEQEVIDHLTTGTWSEGLRKTELRWQLTDSAWHRIEAVQPPRLSP